MEIPRLPPESMFESNLIHSFSFYTSLSNGRINVPLLYLHRYLRLTPVLAVAIFVTMTILTKYSNGPLWHVLIDGSSDCDANWWGALLYIQNYFNSEKMV